METGKTIRVLVADDSAFMRKVLVSILNADPQMEVAGEARDGKEVVSLCESLKPDVITMDINMPHVNGLEATEVIMSTNPRPIVIVSSESKEGAETTLRALELGAIDFVPKPSSGIDLDMESVRDDLCRKLKMAAKVRVVRTATRPRTTLKTEVDAQGAGYAKTTPAGAGHSASARGGASISMASANGRFPVVVLSASTGGPATLMKLVPNFPRDFPGAVILVQHMPGTFTSQFGQQLAEVAQIRVKDAEAGEMLRPGTFYVCPGSHHLRVGPNGRIALDEGQRIHGYRPNCDVALESVAAFAGPMTISVVLTGMGSDGAKGSLAVKAAGGHVIAQDEATCVIFGMPAEAIRVGAVDQVLPLDNVYTAIDKRVLYVFGADKVGAL